MAFAFNRTAAVRRAGKTAAARRPGVAVAAVALQLTKRVPALAVALVAPARFGAPAAAVGSSESAAPRAAHITTPEAMTLVYRTRRTAGEE
jgi:hypothetical protein